MFMYYFILFFILRLSTAQGDCTPTRCSDHGPKIRFPFRLKNHHPPHCGYPGFDLSCSPNTTATLLNLPYSVQVLVTNIDYKSQLIHIKDPNNCFPQQLQNLNLSTTPFQFPDPVYDFSDFSYFGDFSLFSCPPSPTNPDSRYRMIPCLSGIGREVGREVRVGHYYESIVDAPVISCRKMFDVPSVPHEVFDQTPHLQLKWPQPVCGACEAKGKFCRLKRNSTSDEIECFGVLKKGILASLLSVTMMAMKGSRSSIHQIEKVISTMTTDSLTISRIQVLHSCFAFSHGQWIRFPVQR